MASPKHLWSGDWERESSQRTPPPVQAPVERSYDIRPEPEPEPRPSPDRASRRRLIAAAIVAVLVIVGVVLAATVGSSKKKTPIAQTPQTTPAQPTPFGNSGGNGLYTQTLPQQSTTPQTTPQVSPTQTEPNVAAGPTYDWLGMQINVTGDGVTVGSITPGSTADQAGVDPGDVIEAINAAQVTSISALQSAVKGIKTGQRFQLIVDRGSTPVTITATLTGRPVKQ